MISIGSFAVARLPRLHFGRGTFALLPQIVQGYGRQVLLVVGRASFAHSPHAAWLKDALGRLDIEFETLHVTDEPSPQLIDDAVARFRSRPWAAVAGIGGGSVLDAAKAIAGLLRPGNSVLDHLEGVGPQRPYHGPAVPLIAVPTTAGTGSEMTKNAVLSVHGPAGFKKSFRDDKLIAEYALIDPTLLASCPPALIAANGMDALTQLLESYVSLKANPMMDALAWSGLEAARAGLLAWYQEGAQAEAAQDRMAYAAMLSGITLAQVGLGSVHGLASPLGAFFPIPHGVACGTVLAKATEVNIRALQAREPGHPALRKYARVASLLTESVYRDESEAHEALVAYLDDLTQRMRMPRLSEFGVQQVDIARIVANCRGSSMKTNPIVVTDDEVAEILRARL
ncbi:MAG: iron-containing alcohol dehydrogenase [Pseudomonadota bacterium]